MGYPNSCQRPRPRKCKVQSAKCKVQSAKCKVGILRASLHPAKRARSRQINRNAASRRSGSDDHRGAVTGFLFSTVVGLGIVSLAQAQDPLGFLTKKVLDGLSFGNRQARVGD